MNEVRVKFNELLKAHFNAKTVGGADADFGITLPAALKSTITMYFVRTATMQHPSISVVPVQTSPFEALDSLDPGTGVEQLKLDIIIRAEPERQGWAVCAAIEKELRTFLNTVNKNRLANVAVQGRPLTVHIGQPNSTDYVDEPALIAFHVLVPLIYARPNEVNS